MNDHSDILSKARGLKKQLIDWRRDIHMHPELGFNENRTSSLVVDVLNSLGYRVKAGIGRTGVIADIGNGPPRIAIRADMDALPIQETNQVSYASQKPGVMHACGHDAHTAIAMGVATLLSNEKFPGSFRFLFQPAEEVEDDEGISGAPRMIADGAIKGVDHVLALHMDASTPTGTISIDVGSASAGVDTFYATIIGQDGHGAKPQDVVDSIYLSGHIILALHGIVSRRIHPFDPAVISIGTIHAGKADNVLPREVELTGTIRYLDELVQKKIHNEIERVMGIAKTLGGDYRLKIQVGYPPMFNDAMVSEIIKETANNLLGPNCIESRRMEMGAEDFGFFLIHAPGAMFRLGCRIEGDQRKHHSSRFDIDEKSLPIGVAVLAESALRLVQKPLT